MSGPASPTVAYRPVTGSRVSNPDDFSHFVEAGVPEWEFHPDRLLAASALSERGTRPPLVEVRCAHEHKGKSCGKLLGQVWTTPYGHLLTVKWHNPALEVWELKEEHERLLSSLDFPVTRLSDDLFTQEEAVLLGRAGQRFPAWCVRHGSWLLDEGGVEEKVRLAKRLGVTQVFGAIRPI
jgi:hypothetical protein